MVTGKTLIDLGYTGILTQYTQGNLLSFSISIRSILKINGYFLHSCCHTSLSSRTSIITLYNLTTGKAIKKNNSWKGIMLHSIIPSGVKMRLVLS